MSGFDLGWLDLREPADRAARDADLLRRAADYLGAGPSLVAVDLGCGSGSTFRALDPLLVRKPVWRLVDNDPVLLAEAGRRAGPDQATVKIAADLSDLDPSWFDGATLVTASALLDLTSEAWIEALAERLAAGGAGLYAALSYDGEMSWAEPHPLDGAVTAAFNAHQRSDKGVGPALGPDAAQTAAELLKARGFEVLVASSPWRLGPGEVELERQLIDGIAQAAEETGMVDDVPGWRRFRLGRAGTGCVVGHQDLLALPAP
jgi:hypothetical protein